MKFNVQRLTSKVGELRSARTSKRCRCSLDETVSAIVSEGAHPVRDDIFIATKPRREIAPGGRHRISAVRVASMASLRDSFPLGASAPINMLPLTGNGQPTDMFRARGR